MTVLSWTNNLLAERMDLTLTRFQFSRLGALGLCTNSPLRFFRRWALGPFLMNGAIGIGRMVLVLCSLEISLIVCKKRSCRAIGCAEIIDGRLREFLGGLKLGFGVYDFRTSLPLRLGLASHRPL